MDPITNHTDDERPTKRPRLSTVDEEQHYPSQSEGDYNSDASDQFDQTAMVASTKPWPRLGRCLHVTQGGYLPNDSIFFDWKSRTMYKWLSNFNKEEIQDLHGTKTVFKSAEHFYQAYKAFWARNRAAYNKIVRCGLPAKAREIGNTIEPFDGESWNEASVIAMRSVLWAKFVGNMVLQQNLIDTGDSLIVEAETSDTRWSSGLSIKDTRSTKMSEWPGRNLLGEVLMEVRDKLKTNPNYIVDKVLSEFSMLRDSTPPPILTSYPHDTVGPSAV